jgi:hypothetical protein
MLNKTTRYYCDSFSCFYCPCSVLKQIVLYILFSRQFFKPLRQTNFVVALFLSRFQSAPTRKSVGLHESSFRRRCQFLFCGNIDPIQHMRSDIPILATPYNRPPSFTLSASLAPFHRLSSSRPEQIIFHLQLYCEEESEYGKRIKRNDKKYFLYPFFIM